MRARMNSPIEESFLKALAGLISAALIGAWVTVMSTGKKFVTRKEIEQALANIDKAIIKQNETDLAVIHERMRHGEEKFSHLQTRMDSISHEIGNLQAGQYTTNSKLDNLSVQIAYLVEATERRK